MHNEFFTVHNCHVTCPIYKSECQSKNSDGYDGPIHAVIGNAGQQLDFHILTPDVESYTRHYAEEFGYSTIHVQGNRTLDFKVYGDQPNMNNEKYGHVSNEVQFDLHYEISIDRTSDDDNIKAS